MGLAPGTPIGVAGASGSLVASGASLGGASASAVVGAAKDRTCVSRACAALGTQDSVKIAAVISFIFRLRSLCDWEPVWFSQEHKYQSASYRATPLHEQYPTWLKSVRNVG